MASPSVIPLPLSPALANAPAIVAAAGPLVRAMRDEHAVLEDLIDTLERQRRAVATDDIDSVNDSVFAAHRLLGAYREARSRRRSVVMMLVGQGEGSVEDLPRDLGARLSDAERGASDSLRDAARRLMDAVDQNRRLLQAAMSSGDAFFRVLAGANSAPQSYAPPSRSASASVGQRIVDLRG